MLLLYVKFQNLMESFKDRFLRKEEGQGLIEYTLLLFVILLLVIATVRSVGSWVNNTWTSLNSTLTAT